MSKEIEKDLKDKEQEMKLKEQQALEFYHFLKEKGCILFETVVGSQAHGTSTPQSDVDKAFIYILPQEFIYGTKYQEQLRIHKDYTGFEIRRFLELAQSNNPTILELLYSPEDCVVTKHPVFQHAIDIRDQILTKRCRDSFAGYAKKQIEKAKGLDKMQNWEKERVTRKEPIDFCYIIEGYGTKPLKIWLDENEYEQKFCGVSKIPNARDVYAIFYDHKAHLCFSDLMSTEDKEHNKKILKEKGETVGLGYKGVAKTGVGENAAESNQLRLSSIPKGEEQMAILIYNKDGYTAHCKDYASYQVWLENRNEQRWVDNKEHGQQYDGKNLMHCKRLLQIAREIAETGTVQIRRPNPEELQDIRKGRVNLEELLHWAQEEMNALDAAFDNCNLPDEVGGELINQTLIKIRKDFYEGNFVVDADKSVPGASKFIKRHGNLTEFQTLLRNLIMERLPNPYYPDSFAKQCKLVEHDDVEGKGYYHSGGYIRIIDLIPLKKWPKSRMNEENMETEEDKTIYEDAEFENIVIFGLSDNKLTLGGGGDWQQGVIFDIVEHGDGFTVINEREEGWDEPRFEHGDLFEWLDIPVPDKFDEEE
ncbi:MAG: nucleotidyltransferase domain-containing protein [Nanoarchaeota archaeon]